MLDIAPVGSERSVEGMEYTVAGHTIRFPHAAYGVQLSFMGKALQTLASRSNALLEAPTGSGKTLSLLCSSLAWQEAVKLQRQEERVKQQQLKAEAELAKAVEDTQPSPAEDRRVGQSDGEEEDEVDEKKPKQKPKENWNPPRIFYATRTHSQIAQVVNELRRTTYRPKMAILASKDHYCVNKTVVKKPNKDEECDKLLGADGDGCVNFKNTAGRMYGLQTSIALQVHDIEDLCRMGRQMQSCPYFAARHYAEEAEIIFCPYNYLIDPVIRKAMNVEISDAVLIFDEAHNIEDNARDAASAEIEYSMLVETHSACVRMSQLGSRPDIFSPLADRVLAISTWLRQLADAGLQDIGRDKYEGVWSRAQMMEELERGGLAGDDLDSLQKLYAEVKAEEAREREQREGNAGGTASEAGVLKLGGLAHGVLSRLLTTLKLMTDAGEEHVADYKLVVQRWRTSSHTNTGSRFRKRHNLDEADVPEWRMQFCLWCLNPAIAFWELNDQAHSVMLTSGTLAPLDTFASELGAEFPMRLEAPHVVNMRKQVLVNVISSGLSGKCIQATYRGSSDPAFPEEVGRVILSVCKTVPDGVLVFLPSYSLLDRLMRQWQDSGLWRELNQLKPAVVEPRSSGADFDSVMSSYYEGIRTGRGGIFFAVCRGKVSEGLDFADGHARAVLVLGIPYPNVKDTKVGMKKKYNDEGSRSRPLLSGDLWYMQQAFRALNQAIGRCLRHRNDYGAILLMDERFGQVRNQTYLSRWVKGSIVKPPSFDAVMSNLAGFFERVSLEFPTNGEANNRFSKPSANCSDTPDGQSDAQAVSEAGRGVKPPTTKALAKPGQPGLNEKYATVSQPTLQNVWSNPGQVAIHKPPKRACLSARPSREQREPDAASIELQQAAPHDRVRRLPLSWQPSAKAVANGWVKPSTPPIHVQPGQVKLTQNLGNGAAGVLGAFAPMQSMDPCQGHAVPSPITPNPTAELSSPRRHSSPTDQRLSNSGPALDVKPAGLRVASHRRSSVPAVPSPLNPSWNPASKQSHPDPPLGLTSSQDNVPEVDHDKIELCSAGREQHREREATTSRSDRETVKIWVKQDVASFAEALRKRGFSPGVSLVETQHASMEAIMDCFLIAMDTSLQDFKRGWSGPLPTGIQLLLAIDLRSSYVNANEEARRDADRLVASYPSMCRQLSVMKPNEALRALTEIYDEHIKKEFSKMDQGLASVPENQDRSSQSPPSLPKGPVGGARQPAHLPIRGGLGNLKENQATLSNTEAPTVVGNRTSLSPQEAKSTTKPSVTPCRPAVAALHAAKRQKIGTSPAAPMDSCNRQDSVHAKTPVDGRLELRTSPVHHGHSNPESGVGSGHRTTPEPPMSVWPSGFESDGLHESFYQCSAADSRGPTQQQGSPACSQSMNLLGGMSAAEDQASRGSDHKKIASLPRDPQMAQADLAPQPQCAEKGSVCLAASPELISSKNCHIQQRGRCSPERDLASKGGSASVRDRKSSCSTSGGEDLPHRIPSPQTHHKVLGAPGVLQTTKPVSGKVLSKNAAAAAQEAQRRLAQQNKEKSVKLEGWDSDSDLESI